MKARFGSYCWTFLLAVIVAGCNLPSGALPSSTLSVTQAYQTVEARLTQAVGLTLEATPTPSPSESSTTPTVTEAATPEPSETPTEAVTAGTQPSSCDQAAPGVPIDVTIPDDTKLEPGEAFTKIWRLQNTGKCAWTNEYSLVWFSGEQLGAPASVPLSGNVEPGQTVEIAVDMVAPQQPGTFQSNWKLRNDTGVLFGIGPSGDAAFWVRIMVTQSATAAATTTPGATTTPTVTPTAGIQASGTITLQPGDQLDLDSIQVTSGDSADIAYQVSEGIHVLNPLGSAAGGSFGNTPPALGDCQTLTLSADPLVVDGSTLVGSYLCYRTNLALPGWVQITGFDADTGALSLEILIWAIP